VSTPHDEQHEALLAEIAAGERSAEEPASAALLSRCAECRAALTALREAAEHVERAGERTREALAESRAIEDAPGLERVTPTLARLADEPRGPRPPRLRLLTLLALVAAGLLLVIGPLAAYRLWTRAEAPAPPLMLGDDDLRLIEPVGEVRDFKRFAWEYSGEASGFDLRIYDDAADPAAAPVLTVRWNETSWVPTPDVRATLPERIRWEVQAIDAFGVGQESRPASAQRSSR
jgi:hypothetical protein